MRAITIPGLIFTTVFIWLLDGCKTGAKKVQQDVPDSNLASTMRVMPDGSATMNNQVPSLVHSFQPAPSATSSSKKKMSSVSLSLSGNTSTAKQKRPVTNNTVENIEFSCSERDSKLLSSNTYFYAELIQNGNIVKQHNAEKVAGCNQMQLKISSLQKSQSYVVYANFYWASEDGKQTIILYEGQTQPFKPSDVSLPFKLNKKFGDQKLNIEIEKTPKDVCEENKFLWTGTRCLDQAHALVFSHSDKSDYSTDAGDAGARDRKCLTLGQTEDKNPSGESPKTDKAYQYDCAFNRHQLFVPKVYAISRSTPIDNNMQAEFTLEVNSGAFGGKKCLTVKDDEKDSFPFLVYRDCFYENTNTGATQQQAGVNRPDANQLFTITEATPGDVAGRETFMIKSMSTIGTKNLCISLPPVPGDPIQGSPLLNNVRAYLTECQNSTESIRQTQFFRFQQQQD